MKIKIAVLLTFLVLLGASKSFAENPFLDSVRVDGNIRRFWMCLPDEMKEGAPLVFVLHGYGNSGSSDTWMNAASSRHGFALCVPCGLKDPAGKPSWNVGYPFQEGWKVNDVKAMCSIARHVCRKHKLSKENIFLTGMSNGGEMCYLLAYSDQKVFKALASLSGLTMEWVYRTKEASRPIPIMEVHGTEDRTSEWEGDLANKGGWGAYMSTPIGVGYWIARNRCEGYTSETVDSKSDNGRKIVKHRYSADNTSKCDVWLYEVIGGPHSWFTEDLDVGEEIWRFFCKYIKN